MAIRVHGTLVAATASPVTIDTSAGEPVVVMNHGTVPIYLNAATGVAATVATVAGDGTICVPAGGYRLLDVGVRSDVRLSLISSGTPSYSAERVNEDFSR